jgi:hypothetical protein
MRKIKKRGEFNFEWIFAMIAGAAILILAIYGAVRFGNTLKYQSDSELSKQLSIILDPLQPGFAEGKSSRVIFNQNTRINNFCESYGFGSNKVSISTESKGSWGEPGAGTSIINKYIFSSAEGGKDYVVFSKQFELGFEVSSILVITAQKYCFINPPSDIESDIKSINLENFKVNNQICENSSIRVCFQSANNKINSGNKCDITIVGTCNSCDNEYKYGYVEKGGQRLNYINTLMYGAIVSDYELYICNVKRLLYRAGELSYLYGEKANLMQSRSCSNDLKVELDSFSSLISSASKSDRLDSSLISINQLAEEITSKNNAGECELW